MLKYLIFVCLVHQILSNNDYCNFPCGKEHTVCRRQTCGLSDACGPKAEPLPLDDADREFVLEIHNKLRNKVALGEDTMGGNGAASNMNILSYDKDLEYVAQCWANACRDTGKPHDVCRDTKKFSPAGQNMFYSGSSRNENFRDTKYIKSAVEDWYSEIRKTNAGEIDSFKGVSGIIGHFTQLVWANTTHIGCGRTHFINPKNNFFAVNIYCNYGLSGNSLGSAVYKRGAPCSACPSGCSKTYPGLCAAKGGESDSGKPAEPGAATEKRISFYTIVVMFLLSMIFWN